MLDPRFLSLMPDLCFTACRAGATVGNGKRAGYQGRLTRLWSTRRRARSAHVGLLAHFVIADLETAAEGIVTDSSSAVNHVALRFDRLRAQAESWAASRDLIRKVPKNNSRGRQDRHPYHPPSLAQATRPPASPSIPQFPAPAIAVTTSNPCGRPSPRTPPRHGPPASSTSIRR